MNLCFDECIPPKWFRLLCEMFKKRNPPIQSVHLLDRLRQGTKDDAVVDWLLKQSPPIMMVSADSGKNTKRGDPRLHLLCPQNSITSVFLSSSLCQKPGFEKVRMMMICMPELEAAYHGVRGSRYRLEKTKRYYRIEAWPVVTKISFPSVSLRPAEQSELFELQSDS